MFPYQLYVQRLGTRTQDTKGQWETSADSWQKHSPCRDQVNDKGNTVGLEDGEATVYTALIQLPAGTKPVAQGTLVQVRDERGKVRQQGTVKRFQADILHSRIWL